jgi:uncharacterized SAM-binding protein YcdF (DUF218 family)
MGSTDGTAKRGSGRRLPLFLWVSGITFVLGATTTLIILLGLGKWLVREDPLRPARAIAVLSGNIPVRALEAAQLYRQGYAREIWLTHPAQHVDPLKDLGIFYPSEDDFNIRVLRREGIPAKAIRVLDMPVLNTAEELDAISSALETQGGLRVIIVTNRAHTRRVHLLWSKYYDSRGSAIVHGVMDDGFEADHWWRYSGSMTQVVHEVLGILNVWAGMPVQSAPRPPDAIVAQEPQSAVPARASSGSTD